MTEVIKKLVVVFVVLLILCGICKDNERREQLYTFKSEEDKVSFLNGLIINEADAPQAAIDAVVSELLKLPDSVWVKFFRHKGKITLTYHLPLSEEGTVTGSLRVVNSTYYEILIHPDYVEYSLLHEVGHYVYHTKSIAQDERYHICLQERSSTLCGVLSNESYFSSDEEYFAEMFKLYFSGVLKEMDAPYFCQYIKQQVGS